MDQSVQGREVCLEAFRYLENVTVYQLKVIRYLLATKAHSSAPFFFGKQCFLYKICPVFNFDTAWQCCGSGSCLSLWCGSGSYLSLCCGSGSGSWLASKGSKPWKSAQIWLFSIHFGLSSANWCVSGSSLSRTDPTFQFDAYPDPQHCCVGSKKLFSTGVEVTTTKTPTHRKIY